MEDEEESRAQNVELIAQLKDQVRRAEDASEQYRKQVEVLQARLDEITEEQTTAEEREYSRRSEVDGLQAEAKESARQRRELEQSHENEMTQLLNDRQAQAGRESELQSVIQRLNESLRSRDARRSSSARNEEIDEASAAAASDAAESSINDLIQEKNKAIENLRLELAEAHIKVAEMEHIGDGRYQDLEKALMDVKMQNARLREDNESFQYLLSEKTLKGDFLHDERPTGESKGLSSLAEELETFGDGDEDTSEAYKRLEAEVKSLRDGNKALTLYIDKIIGRILKHEGFEHIIVDKDDPPEPPSKPMSSTTEKALPATPDQQMAAGAQPSLLQRARSVVARQPAARPRPASQMPAVQPTANENPETAPSIPLNRGHRRARSDQAQKDMQKDMGAAAVVQQMNRGSPLRTASGGAMSPGISPLSPQLNPSRASYFQPSTTPSGRTPSAGGTAQRDREHGSSRNSIASEVSGEKESTDASSAPTSNQGSSSIPGAVMKQNQLRPLRLVREQNDEQEAQKKANRGSWMGWLKGTGLETQ